MVDDKIVIQEGVEFEGNVFARTPDERAAWYQFYREIIRLRKRTPALVHGSLALLDAGEKSPEKERTVVAFERKWKRTTVRCAINMGSKARRLKHAERFDGKLLYGAWEGGILPPFSAIVVRCI